MNDASDLTEGQAARTNAASVERQVTPTATTAHVHDDDTCTGGAS